jgi:hypothetical protein
MSMVLRTKCFGLIRFCAIAITCAAYTAPAAGQRSAEREDKDQIDAESSRSDDEKVLLKAIEEQRAIAEQQRAEAAEQYRRAMSELERVRRRGSNEAAAERAKVQEQLDMARAQLAASQKRAKAGSLPDNAVTKIFALRHSQAPDTARLLSEVLGSKPLRIAVDERTNSLVVFADQDTSDVIEALVMKLDQSVSEVKNDRPSETLQVRIVWLLDIDDGLEPNDKLVSPEVVDALGELGFEHPKVVCQQVTTLTLGEKNRRGQFHFQVPVLIQSQPWQFEGQGQIEPMAGSRFSMKFDMGFKHMNTIQGGGKPPTGYGGHLGGSIYTPLGHYTVMGTTTFIGQADAPLPDDRQPGEVGTGDVVQNQHLSAFVVYLDRAREFPASNGKAEDRNSERRR